MIASQVDIGLRYGCLIIFVQLEKVKNEAQVAESHKDMKLDLIISMRDKNQFQPGLTYKTQRQQQ